MMYTTICLSAHQATAHTGKSATDLVEFYADASPPCYKTEFKKDSRLILQCTCGEWSALAAVNLERNGYTNVGYLDGAFSAWKKAGLPVNERYNFQRL